jgi:hypothetical protein
MSIPHPLQPHNKPSLYFLLSCRTRLLLKGETVLGFVFLTVKVSGARTLGNRMAGSLGWIATDSEGGVEGHGRQSPSPSQTAGRERATGCVALGPMAWTEQRSYQILLSYTVYSSIFL